MTEKALTAVKFVETSGSFCGGSLRFRAGCTCGWSTGLFVAAMQAHHAVEDHVCAGVSVQETRPETQL